MNPLVSVVISTYNLGWCIGATLKSVFTQTYKPMEVIVVDDASTDDTPTKIAPFLERITYIRHSSNQGRAMQAEGGPARNTGIGRAKGDYIAFLDGDDLWEPDKIAVQVEAAGRFPQAGLIVADGFPFSHEDGAILRSSLLHDYGDNLCASLPEDSVVELDLYHRLLRGCVIDTPSQVMVPSNVVHTIGLFAQHRADDYDFYLRIAATFPVVLIKKHLVKYRVHTDSVSGPLAMQFFQWTQPNISIWRKHLKVCRADIRPFVRQQINYGVVSAAERARDEGLRGKRRWASRFLLRLIVKNPLPPASLSVALSLVRLWTPWWVVTIFRPVTRRLIRFRYELR